MDQVSLKSEILIKGVAAAPGVASGAAFVFHQSSPNVLCYPIEEESISAEKARFEDALLATRREISALRDTVAGRLGEKEAAIFDAHLLALDDPALIDETLRMLHEEKCNVAYCFFSTAEKFINFFSNLDDEYFKARAGDVRDITQRILHHLLGLSRTALSDVMDDRIIVANDLTPSDTAGVEKKRVLAIVTDEGNRTSHTAIMSRALRIPAVVGLIVASKKIEPGDEVLVDGYEGVVYVNPSEETRYRYGLLKKERDAAHRRMMREADQPDLTLDEKPFVLSANVNSAEDMASVRENRANGIGLFRTEGVFLKTPWQTPGEDTQFEYYKAVIAAAKPAFVVVRTLDIGGDKPHVVHGAPGANPFMGFRAIRICLENKAVFRTQLRAILRASAFGNVKIMFPMISSLDELVQAREFYGRVLDELRETNVPVGENIDVGAMIEIPSAAIMADNLAQHCDFFSIGTNDLVQYLLAVDRGNGRIAHLYEPCNPAVLRTLRDVIDAAKQRKIPVSVCGEMAGDPMFAPLLIALGADALSMSSAAIPGIRYLLRHVTTGKLETLKDDVFSETNPVEIKKILLDFSARLMGHVPGGAPARALETTTPFSR
ncbi:MAG: phosphoenolpyruvate--protein phosphotransferase [Puniceicoccales bacterium]|jgi:phosphotransferase system enzyme I (PtsI)|nr:phosphoenolpyruvate--protein phosphotransferase [Puniceicoccales bacterium]